MSDLARECVRACARASCREFCRWCSCWDREAARCFELAGRIRDVCDDLRTAATEPAQELKDGENGPRSWREEGGGRREEGGA
eukprot:3456347-Rhodomonas_salina.3